MKNSDKNKQLTVDNQVNDFTLYTSPDGNIKVEVLLSDDNIWLDQEKIALLFGIQRVSITRHLANIFAEGELDENLVSSILERTANDGKKYQVKFYNIDAIIAVGYRVNTNKATQFRIWATAVLKEYIIKGFAMNDEFLKNGNYFRKDYFKELLERVRSIRASERRIYQQITDIFAECSIDYDSKSDITREFYATVQNKFHVAITGKTAAEIIHSKADKDKSFMGLINWKKGIAGKILKSDTTIAKNYLTEQEIKRLERTVSAYFDYIEGQIEQRRKFTMSELSKSVNAFIEFNKLPVSDGVGKITKKQADEKALAEYAEFNKSQKIESDFDRAVKKFIQSNKNSKNIK